MTMILIQARMSSRRLPGKVLKKINGKTILSHIARRCESVVGRKNVAIITSVETSDNPIVEFAEKGGYSYYRGSLNNVYERFVETIRNFGINHFVRVCGDSPFLQPDLIHHAITLFKENDVDLVTNVFPRTYPKGQSVEVVKTSVFLEPEYAALAGFSSEHVTQGFYSHSNNYKILNLKLSEIHPKTLPTWAVDTYEDLALLTDWIAKNPDVKPFGFPIIKLNKPQSSDA